MEHKYKIYLYVQIMTETQAYRVISKNINSQKENILCSSQSVYQIEMKQT